jgi:hypothetical protein
MAQSPAKALATKGVSVITAGLRRKSLLGSLVMKALASKP